MRLIKLHREIAGHEEMRHQAVAVILNFAGEDNALGLEFGTVALMSLQ